MKGRMSSPQLGRIDPVARPMLKNLLAIGAGLQTPRHLQALLSDIMDKIVAPCRERGLTRDDMTILFDAMASSYSEPSPDISSCFPRLLRGMSPVILRFFH
jgi:hypothetical protein